MKKLREIRELKGISIKQLSRECGIADTTIGDYERDKIKKLNINALRAIATALNADIEEIQKNIAQEERIKQCLNQRCPLNKNKLCQSIRVIEGAYCQNQNEVTKKTENKKTSWALYV